MHFYWKICGQVIKLSTRIIALMPKNPKNPSKNTIFKGYILYLLNIAFYIINAAVLNTSDTISSTTPMICSIVVCYFDYDLSLRVIQNTCTRVMPTTARTHPRIDDLVNFFLRNIFENIAVVTMTPPRDICHTEPAISPRDMQANNEDNKSINAGMKGKQTGHQYFINPDLSRKFFWGRRILQIQYGKMHKNSPRNIKAVWMNGCVNLVFYFTQGIF